jgi:threonine aldolase
MLISLILRLYARAAFEGCGATVVRMSARSDLTRRPGLRLHDPSRRGFLSDNTSGVHPDVLAAIVAANEGHQPSYGADRYTARLQEVVAEQFGGHPVALPVFNGTGANVVGLQSLVPRWGAVICAAAAHINVDENAAPERVAGLKLLPVETPDGKLTPELVDRQAWGFDDFHRAQPSVVSLTQSTEAGTVYTLEEMRAIAVHARALDLKVHVDGSRLSNAAARLGCSLADINSGVGVDVVSFGGTKNGLLYGECVVAFDSAAADGLVRLRKLDMQLSSKMRFVSAQLIAVLTDDLWRRNASHANEMATLLRSRLEAAVAAGSLRAEFPRATEANELFVRADPAVTDRLARDFPFETWDRSVGEVRFVCSFDTEESDIDALLAAWVRSELANA